MSKIVIKKDFKNGDKLYDVDLNNNFMVIEAGVNANEENLEEIIEEAEARLTAVFKDEAATMEAEVAADNLATKNAIIADNDATEQAIKDDNDATEQAIKDDNAATVEAIRNLVVEEGWDWGGATNERVRFFKGNTSAVSGQPIINGQLLFDKESGIIALDDNNARTLLGGALWDETPKKPVKYKRKTTAEIAVLPVEDGSVIYNTDNGKQFMDIGNSRIPTGGAGGEVVLDDADITEDTKLIIEDEDIDGNFEVNTETYSTSEILTNKVWLGNPVYRKVIEFGALPNNTTKSVNHNISNLGEIINFSALAKNTSGTYYPLPYLSSTNSSNMFIYFNSTQITIQTAQDRSGLTCNVMLEYTKSS